MLNVVFAAPYFLDATQRFAAAAAELPGVRLGIVSAEPLEKIPAAIRQRLAQHWRVGNLLDPKQLAAAVEGIASRIGTVERLIGTLEELQVPLAEVRQQFGIQGLSVETAHNFRDKSRMKDVLRRAGLPCARHRLCDTSADCRQFANEVGFPLVAKPPAGAGARNTFRIEDIVRFNEWIAAAPPRPGQAVLLEEFVTGEEHSFDSVTVAGRTVWSSISRYYPTPLEVLENAWIQWCVLLPRDISGPAYRSIHDIGPQALAALGLDTGVTHMEWFRRPDGSVAISEVAVRPPGAQFTTLISYAHDFDFYGAWAHLMVHGEFEPRPRRYAVGAAYLRGQGQGRVRAVHGLEEAGREIGSLVVESSLPKVGDPHRTTYEGVGYVIVRHPDTAVVERALARLVTTIRVELA